MRDAELETLREEMERANLPLKSTATNLVFYRGTPQADIFIVGEAPGKTEDEEGKPFLGRAGTILDKALEKAKLQDSIYISNIVCYRPPQNRAPRVKEMEAHGVYLLRQIKIVQPKVVIPLGNTATKYLVSWLKDIKKSEVKPITQLRGKPLETTPILLPTFHPAATLYDNSKRPVFYEDIERAKHLLK